MTGDQHESYAAELWDTGFALGSASGAQVNPAGRRRASVEFVVTSVTSANMGDLQGAAAAVTEAARRRELNPHVRYADLTARRYGDLEAGPDQVRFPYRFVDRLAQDAAVTAGPAFRVARGRRRRKT